MEKNNKETKKADFIDLDKSQFRKKPSIFIFLFFGLFVIVVICSYFLKERYQSFTEEIKNLKISLEESQNNLKNYQTLNVKQEDVKKNSKIADDIFLESSKGSNRDTLDEIKQEFLRIKDTIENDFSLEERNKLKSIIQDVTDKQNKLYTFIIFKKKIINDESFEREINSLKDFFLNDEEVFKLLDFFSNTPASKNLVTLYKQLDMVTKGREVQIIELSRDGTKNQEETISKRLFFSKESIETYFKDILNSNFRIKKINKESDLSDYSDLDNDGIFDFENALDNAKKSLILKDIESAIIEIESISSPLTYGIEKWIIDAQKLQERNIKLDFLEEKILEHLIDN
ncbi:hypothetical protein OA848_00770 [Rickettsiales bacterium]|nr:hypothetical protein [Rickettsiales bacterium]